MILVCSNLIRPVATGGARGGSAPPGKNWAPPRLPALTFYRCRYWGLFPPWNSVSPPLLTIPGYGAEPNIDLRDSHWLKNMQCCINMFNIKENSMGSFICPIVQTRPLITQSWTTGGSQVIWHKADSKCPTIGTQSITLTTRPRRSP